jgi:uncharacterized membrane protein HdeD (DUF308 family)
MMFTESDLVGSMARYWWAFALRGLAAIVFGVLALIWPGITATVLVIMFGAYALWDGVFDLIAAFRTEGSRRWALVLEGIIGILAGLAAFFWPGVATFALLYIIAGWAVVTGILEILTAIRLREEIEGEWMLMLAGALSIIFGIALALWPAAGVMALTWMIGGYAILFGILLIVLAFRLRGLRQGREATTA